MERARSSARRWPGMVSEYAWLPPHAGETVTRAGQVGVAFSAHSHVGYEVDGRAQRATYPGGAVIVSGAAPIVWTDVRETTEAVEIYLDPGLLRRLSDGDVTARRPVIDEPRVGVTDPVVLGVASILRRVHTSGRHLSDVGADSLAHLLARHVLHRYAGIAADSAGGPTRLPWRDICLVHDLVESRLAGPLTLRRLADAVHLSPFHFARAFKASVGMAPHAFVTSRRIDHARVLLVNSTHSVNEIAWRVGFTNLSHFRRVFRAHTGVLPSHLRS